MPHFRSWRTPYLKTSYSPDAAAEIGVFKVHEVALIKEANPLENATPDQYTARGNIVHLKSTGTCSYEGSM